MAKKTNGRDWANPVTTDLLEKERLGHFNNTGETSPFGLTKIEHFAGLAMQGILSNSDGCYTKENNKAYSPDQISELAVQHAKALINELNK